MIIFVNDYFCINFFYYGRSFSFVIVAYPKMLCYNTGIDFEGKSNSEILKRVYAGVR